MTEPVPPLARGSLRGAPLARLRWGRLAAVLSLLLGAPAFAEDPPAPATPPTPVAEADEDKAAEEVIVYDRLERAREKVIDAAKQTGYTKQVRKNDRTILRHPDPWKGEFVLYDDGRVTFKRQPVRFEPPGGAKSPASYLWCVIFPLCIRPSGQTAGPRLFRANERSALAAVHPEIQNFQERIGDAAVDAKVNALPAKLEKLWTEGVPLDPGPVLESWDDRRAALFAFWDSRTETEWGERVRDAVEAFVRGEVQGSEHPYTPEEIARLNARRTVQRQFLAPRAVALGDDE